MVQVTLTTTEEPILPTRTKALVALGGASALALSGIMPAQAGPGVSARQHDDRAVQSARLVTITNDLVGPRGLAVVNKHKSLVGQADGTVSRVVRRHGHVRVVDFAHVPPSGTGVGPAVARGLHGAVWILTGGAAPETGPVGPGGATLYKWRPRHGAAKAFANIAAYQATDPDPFNLADDPGESNPFGVVALPDGSVLVSDAAGNDLLRVKKNHKIQTVARLKPRTVAWPAGLGFGPPPGTMTPAEAVATSVTVGSDGFWYVGELRGVPATPGTSEIWRIKPGSRNAVCDPVHPRRGHCKRFVDGLTSIVDLAPAPHRRIYALELSKMSWLAAVADTPAPGSDIGGLFKVRRHHVIRELAKGKLHLPGQVDRRRSILEVTGPVFGPGSLFQIR